MEIRFVLPQELAVAPYADMAAVSHNQHGFTIDFAADSGTDEHGVVTAQVVSRVKVPPTVVFQIIKAISENLDNYEKRFGPIAST
jgi:hypothetical protein